MIGLCFPLVFFFWFSLGNETKPKRNKTKRKQRKPKENQESTKPQTRGNQRKPHQFALSTRAGTEAVIHALTAATQANPAHTVLSVDGIGAYDTISRESMLRGLMTVPTANRSLPFVRTFYGQPSQYVWHDDQGRHHLISQAEGGEQGDPLMPALFSLGQSRAVQAIHSQLHPTEMLLAYLDDIYAVVAPDRVRTVYDVMANELRTHTRIQLNSGKARVRNAAGATPPGLEVLGPEVWVGNTTLPREQQGITILGAPLGTAEYVAQQLLHSTQSHQALLERIPTVDDLQSAWLLLLFCASPRCNHTLRTTPPQLTQDFATRHDTSVAACLQTLLGLPDFPATSLATAHLPLPQGGLGLTSATVTAQPAYWASWADTFPVLHQLPSLAGTLLQSLRHPHQPPPAFQAAIDAVRTLEQAGWQPPDWHALTQPVSHPLPNPLEEPLASRGWQHRAVMPIYTTCRNELLTALDPASRAMLESQTGPFASRTFTTIPSGPEFTYPPDLFRILLLRRLRLPLPLSVRHCRCRRSLDSLGDHRAACATSGALRSRAGPLERAAARVCREAGARVATNVLVSDLNVSRTNRLDNRRIEVIAHGLPLHNGAQLAVDTTMVSPLTRSGEPRPQGRQPGSPALRAARQAKERTYPELVGGARCRLVVLAMEVGGKWSQEAADFLRLLAQPRNRSVIPALRKAAVQASIARWSAMLTMAAQAPFAASLILQNPGSHTTPDGDMPPLSTLLEHHPGAPPRHHASLFDLEGGPAALDL